MRLWSQARQMGMYAAKCMSADRLGQPLLQDFCFEMFAHVTRLLGHKLILLGLFNGQRLGADYSALIRMTPGQSGPGDVIRRCLCRVESFSWFMVGLYGSMILRHL